MSSVVTVDNLIVFDFPSECLTTQMKDWKSSKAVPFAMQCSRNIWYGHQEDFKDFPFPEAKSRVRVFQKDQAYAQLLRAIVGEYILHVKRGLKINSNGAPIGYRQFYEGFEAYKRHEPEKSSLFQLLYSQICDDADFIRDVYAERFQRLSFERAALKLTNYKAGESLLLVGYQSPKGNIAISMRGLILTAAEINAGKQEKVTITHPDVEMLKGIEATCMRLKGDGRLKGDIAFKPFDELSVLIEQSDHVFSCIPMGLDMATEMEIVAAWQNRVRRDNKIVAMQRDTQNMQTSFDIWDSEGLDQYFTPEQIGEVVQKVAKQNNILLAHIEEVYALSARHRMENRVPRHVIPVPDDNPEFLIG